MMNWSTSKRLKQNSGASAKTAATTTEPVRVPVSVSSSSTLTNANSAGLLSNSGANIIKPIDVDQSIKNNNVKSNSICMENVVLDLQKRLQNQLYNYIVHNRGAVDPQIEPLISMLFKNKYDFCERRTLSDNDIEILATTPESLQTSINVGNGYDINSKIDMRCPIEMAAAANKQSSLTYSDATFFACGFVNSPLYQNFIKNLGYSNDNGVEILSATLSYIMNQSILKKRLSINDPDSDLLTALFDTIIATGEINSKAAEIMHHRQESHSLKSFLEILNNVVYSVLTQNDATSYDDLFDERTIKLLTHIRDNLDFLYVPSQKTPNCIVSFIDQSAEKQTNSLMPSGPKISFSALNASSKNSDSKNRPKTIKDNRAIAIGRLYLANLTLHNTLHSLMKK